MATRVDASELHALADDFGKAPSRLNGRARKTIRKSAVEIKRGMRADLRAGLEANTYLPDITRKVNFDMRGDLGAEIGIDKGGQGDLGNFAAFGSVNNAPIFDHTASLHREAPRMVDHLADDAVHAALGGTGSNQRGSLNVGLGR